MNDCPCCTDKLLRHLGKSGFYWFCPQCRQTMPITQQHLPQTELETRKY